MTTIRPRRPIDSAPSGRRTSRSDAPARSLVALTVGLALAGASCGPADDPAPGWRVEELPSPAGPTSAEPHLSVSERGTLLSWLEADGEGAHVLYVATWDGGTWREPMRVARRPDLFVNWADVPSVVEVGDGVLAGHWLVRGETGGYDYEIRTAFSRDGGRRWSDPWTPHTDETPTEHGFVTLMGLDGAGMGAIWLDGRDYAAHADGRDHPGHPEGPEMSLRFRRMEPGGSAGPEILLDGRTCDCCQTDAATTARGPVIVYRDRTRDEVRDVSIVRRVDGAWTDPEPVHRDGWVFPACPVNGPAVDARERRVAVSWFTGARDTARVRIAFSSDAGASFGEPLRVDDGDPVGRVDVVLLTDGSAVTAWLERVGGAAEVRIRRVAPDGERGPSTTVGSTEDGRSSGFPQMVPAPGGGLLLAWTDARDEETRIRVARARPERAPGPPNGGGGR